MKERYYNRDPFDIKLGELLKDARKSKKMTQTYVGEKMGCTKQMVSFYEKGVSSLTAKQLKVLCKLYGIDFGETLRKADE